MHFWIVFRRKIARITSDGSCSGILYKRQRVEVLIRRGILRSAEHVALMLSLRRRQVPFRGFLPEKEPDRSSNLRNAQISKYEKRIALQETRDDNGWWRVRFLIRVVQLCFHELQPEKQECYKLFPRLLRSKDQVKRRHKLDSSDKRATVPDQMLASLVFDAPLVRFPLKAQIDAILEAKAQEAISRASLDRNNFSDIKFQRLSKGNCFSMGWSRMYGLVARIDGVINKDIEFEKMCFEATSALRNIEGIAHKLVQRMEEIGPLIRDLNIYKYIPMYFGGGETVLLPNPETSNPWLGLLGGLSDSLLLRCP